MLETDPSAAFTEFVRESRPRLKQSLIAALGPEAGLEAASDALTWAWEHWDKLATMDNPTGYLFRLGRNKAISRWRRQAGFPMPEPEVSDEHWFEPGLPAALAHLSEMQRVSVMLVHGWGWTFREVAEHMGVATGTVQVHIERAMARLRDDLKVELHG